MSFQSRLVVLQNYRFRSGAFVIELSVKGIVYPKMKIVFI